MRAKKNKVGFWRFIIIFLFGAACGTGGIATVAVYVNGLHLPFLKEREQIHSDPTGGGENRARRDTVEFQDILRRRETLVPPAPRADAGEDAAPRRFLYYLQINAYHDSALAENLRAEMTLNGYPIVINEGALADGNTLYRVWAGPYETEDEAEEIRAQLLLEGHGNVQLLQTAT